MYHTQGFLQLPSKIGIRSKQKVESVWNHWLSSRNFFGGGGGAKFIVTQISFVTQIFLSSSDQILGGGGGGKSDQWT